MTLSKVVSVAVVVGALGFGAVNPAAPVASAAPVVQVPEKPKNDFCPPACGNGPGRGHANGHGNGPGNGHRGDGPGDKGAWWAANPHPWWDDRSGPPPWGWGPPPAYQWTGGPPRPFNYWGYEVTPVWDDGFHQWGIWLFGLWIPIFGIGVT